MIDTVLVANSAKKRICIDFDNTLFGWADLDTIPEPLPHAVAAVKEIQAKGYTVFILTSRASRTWWEDHCRGTEIDPDDFGSVQMSIVMRAFMRAGIKDIKVTSEKIPALAYIDDRAIRFEGDWEAILKMIP
jgi:hypothetical protein